MDRSLKTIINIEMYRSMHAYIMVSYMTNTNTEQPSENFSLIGGVKATSGYLFTYIHEELLIPIPISIYLYQTFSS